MDKIIAMVLLLAFIIATLLISPLNVIALDTPFSQSTTETLNNEISVLSSKYDVSEKLVRSIIWCESRGYVSAHNKNGDWSVDYGLMQINDYWHFDNMKKLQLNPQSPHDLLEYGIRLLSTEGSKHWSASSHCWKNDVDVDYPIKL